jgi:hypothetical protein
MFVRLSADGSSVVVQPKNAKMSIHDVDGHLHSIEVEAVVLRYLHHAEMNMGVLVTGETDEAYLPCLFGSKDRFHRSPFVEDSIWVVVANHFMVLQ